MFCGKRQERPINKTLSACVANQSIWPNSPDLTLSTETVASQAYQNSVLAPFESGLLVTFQLRRCVFQAFLPAGTEGELWVWPWPWPWLPSGPISPIGCLRLYKEKSPGGARRDSGLDHVSVIGDCMIDCHLDCL